MVSKKQHIGLFGIGAIGSLIAAELQSENPNNEPYYFNRSPKSYIRHKRGGLKTEIPIVLSQTKQFQQALDWLIVSIKEHHFSAAMESLVDLIQPQTKIVVIRNGLNLKTPFLAFSKESQILETNIDCPCQLAEDGYYQSYHPPIISLAPSPLALESQSLFKNSKTTIHLVEDFKSLSWKKLCESSALGAILCLSGKTAEVFKDKKMQELYRGLLEEGVNIAKADGAKFEMNFIEDSLRKVLSYPPEKGSSMLTDKQLGRPIEWGAKNGLICKVGRTYSIETPENDKILRLLKKQLTSKHKQK